MAGGGTGQERKSEIRPSQGRKFPGKAETGPVWGRKFPRKGETGPGACGVFCINSATPWSLGVLHTAGAAVAHLPKTPEFLRFPGNSRPGVGAALLCSPQRRPLWVFKGKASRISGVERVWRGRCWVPSSALCVPRMASGGSPVCRGVSPRVQGPMSPSVWCSVLCSAWSVPCSAGHCVFPVWHLEGPQCGIRSVPAVQSTVCPLCAIRTVPCPAQSVPCSVCPLGVVCRVPSSVQGVPRACAAAASTPCLRLRRSVPLEPPHPQPCSSLGSVNSGGRTLAREVEHPKEHPTWPHRFCQKGAVSCCFPC